MASVRPGQRRKGACVILFVDGAMFAIISVSTTPVVILEDKRYRLVNFFINRKYANIRESESNRIHSRRYVN